MLNGSAAAISAPAASTAAPTHIAGTRPLTNACGGGVAAVAREHGREHRDAEHAAQLADRVGGAGRLAGLRRCAPLTSTALAAGANTSAMPAPASTNGPIMLV